MDELVEEFTARLLVSVESSVHVTRWRAITALEHFWRELINRETIRSCNYFAPPIDYHAVSVVSPILLEAGYWLFPVRLSFYYLSPSPSGFTGNLLQEEQDSLGGAVLCDIRARMKEPARVTVHSVEIVMKPRMVTSVFRYGGGKHVGTISKQTTMNPHLQDEMRFGRLLEQKRRAKETSVAAWDATH